MSKTTLPDIVVTNLHRRYTGVSATVKALVPIQQQREAIAVLDSGNLGLPGTVGFWVIVRNGWSRPKSGQYRIWHARRDVEMLLGLLLKYVLLQRWKLVFTSAAPKRHRRVLRLIMNRMDAIISTSKRAAGFLDWHTVVVTHGVDTNEFVPKDKAKAKTEIGFTGKQLIGNFGRIRHSKGTDLLIEALLDVLPDDPDCTAIITGEAKESEAQYLLDMQTKITNAGLSERIVFWGDTPFENIKTLYQACDLCVAASRVEGFGLTPLEAMASGTAVLTSEAGFWPELIKPGENGEIFKTDQVADLAQKLRQILLNPETLAQMGKAGRDYVASHHSIQNEVDGIFSVYESLR